ncbi:DNA-directed RNA polymerase subunit beta [Candidatus Poribacteria bacterium]|nr:DNA-directed RNA polymerase subunit beta [Candidatus Poribacteria bacterium]
MSNIVKFGKRERLSYAKIPEVMDLPDLIEIQKKSYEKFLQKDIPPEKRENIGLQEVFTEIFPIFDFSETSYIEFVSYSLGKPKYDVNECQDRGMNYAAPLKAKVRLVLREKDKDTQEKRTIEGRESEIYMSEFPLMTERGTFVINGAERVVVSQLHRSPGVTFSEDTHSSGRKLYSAKIVPYRGAWVEFEYDIKDLIYVRLDRRKKMYATILLRALSDEDRHIFLRLGNRAKAEDVLKKAKEPGIKFVDLVKEYSEDEESAKKDGNLDFFKSDKEVPEIDATLSKLKPGEISNLVESPYGYHIIKAGRHWETDAEILRLFARTEIVKLQPWNRESVLISKEHFDEIPGKIVMYDVVDPETSDTIVKATTVVTELEVEKLRVTGVKEVYVYDDSFPVSMINRVIAAPIVDEATGEVIAEPNEGINVGLLEKLLDAGCTELEVLNAEDASEIEFLRNTLKADKIKSKNEALREIFRKLQPGDPPTEESAKSRLEKLFSDPVRYDLSRVGRYKLNEKLGLSVPLTKGGRGLSISEDVRILMPEDIIEVLRYLMRVQHGKGSVDNIDHLGNRRVKTVGELLQNQFRIGLSRVARVIKERMTIQDIENATPQDIINSKPLSGAIKDFFGSSQLSQFMQQINPLDELTHKRRLSALGPGGLHRDRATFEARDVHHTHYGRVCPIETPEGPSVGLIVSLSTYARVNDYGFLETPYRKVVDGVVTNQIEYLPADKEDDFIIAQANAKLDNTGKLMEEQVMARHRGEYPHKFPEDINYIDVSPKQVVSVSAALIPFLEHDDAGRALMGANQQRQAVPLVCPQAPLIGTGMEYQTAIDSGAVVVAQREGIVESVSADEIIIRTEDAFNIVSGEQSFSEMGYDVYKLLKFKRSNSGTCINQRPIVKVGEKVIARQVIADGDATDCGEIALGANVLVAFMPWEGYNFEDAILISENLARDDVFTSVHIEEFEAEARDTTLGKEEITKDIPNVSPDALKNLDDEGIIRIGSTIEPGDILVGKVTPKGESELGPEEKLLRAIFGEKAGDVRDASLRAKPGHEGVVVDVKVFSRKEREKDKQTKLREDAQIKQVEREWQSKISLINQRKNEEIRKILHRQTLASSISDGESIIGRRGDVITDEMLNRGVPLEQFFIVDAKATNQMLNIKRLAQGRVEALTVQKDERIEKIRKGDELRPGIIKLVKVYVATKRKIQVGDKVAGRHGNKGVISRILPVEDMPYLPDGTSVDVVLNPLGVPSRMNIGQILETHLGWAAKALGRYIATPVFDGAKESDIQKALQDAGLPISGKTKLYDGRTGKLFDQEVTVGYSYIMKLHHLVDDKLHARSTGPYSLVTQQPLGGKAQLGGQRLGEMEVWALEAYGAAYTLQEMLTTKSDDITGRTKIYEAIVKGENAPEPGTPESFNVLVKELQSLGLNVRLEKTGQEGKRARGQEG